MAVKSRVYVVALAVTVIAVGGCTHTQPPPATAPKPDVTVKVGGVPFDGSKWGIKFEYPAGWVPKPNKAYVLYLLPTGAKSEDRSLSMDVPELPPHIPGLIPFGLVKSGYLDDLKKKYPSLQSREEPRAVPGAHAALVLSSWPQEGRTRSETAAILTHADHVYLFRVNGSDPDDKVLRAALDSILRTIDWVK